MRLPRAVSEFARAMQSIEQADAHNAKLTGDIHHNFGIYQQDCVGGLTASTTQTQGQGQLDAMHNLVETVANANDTVTLPPASKGRLCEIYNAGANTLQIFPSSGDSIQGGSVDASTTLAAGSSVALRAFDETEWWS